ncbi:MAG: translation initiation factor IF-3 [Candidatus Caccovivens sp.]
MLKEITTIFKELLINEQITAKEVRLIGAEGEQLGILSKQEAQNVADQDGLDLVLMNPNGNPPVCKLMDYGKYKFDTVKKEKELRKNQKISEVKEIQLTMRIDEYHTSFKLKNAQKILQDGDKVKVSLRMRGREQAYSKNAVEDVKKFVADLSEYGFIEKEPVVMGRNVSVVINPKKTK